MRTPGHELHVVLRDGTRALLRPIRPDDKERLVEGFARLSPESRYLRFHMHVDELTEEQVRYLTEVDGHDHVAWAALDEGEPGQPGMGVARYVRIVEEPAVAEAAITVVDDYQGRGLGTVLLGVLARDARDHGIEWFRNYVLAENQAMIALLGDLGATSEPQGGGVHRIDLPIPDPDEVPDTPAGRTLRAVATGRLRMLVSAIAPVRVADAADGPREARRGGDDLPGSPDLSVWADDLFGGDDDG